MADVINTVPCQSSARLHVAWRSGQEITTCELRNLQRREHGDQPFIAAVPLTRANKAQRKLAHDSLDIYKQQRTFMDLEARSLPHSAIERQCRDYSQNISGIICNSIARPNDSASASYEREDGQAELIVQLATWQLLDIFFLHQDINEGYFPEELSYWLASNEQAFYLLSDRAPPEEMYSDIARSGSTLLPHLHPHFWPTMHRLAALGRIDQVKELLSMVPKARDAAEGLSSSQPDPELELLESLDACVHNFPRHIKPADDEQVAERTGYTSSGKFVAERSRYQEKMGQACATLEVQMHQLRRSGRGALADGASKLIKILAGDERVLLGECSNWVELLVASVYHRSPDVQPHELRLLVERCYHRKQPDEADVVLRDMWSLMMVVGGRDVAQVVMTLSGLHMMDQWFMAHVFDVLRGYPRVSGILDRTMEGNITSLSEFYTLQYAMSLLSRRSTWHLGCEYLAWCSSQGHAAMAAALEQVPHLTTDSRTALRVLHYCQVNRLPAVEAGVCRQLGMACWSRGQLGLALKWLLQARDEQRCALVVAPLLDKVHAQLLAGAGTYALAPLDLPELDDLQALLQTVPGVAHGVGSAAGMSVASGLHFLCHLIRIQQAVQHLHHHMCLSSTTVPAAVAPPAADTLAAAYAAIKGAVTTLYSADLVPPKLRLPLLLYLVPLLESNRLQLSSLEVSQLQQALLGCWLSHQAAEWSKGLDGRHVQDVQLALSRALARSIIEEGTVVDGVPVC